MHKKIFGLLIVLLFSQHSLSARNRRHHRIPDPSHVDNFAVAAPAGAGFGFSPAYMPMGPVMAMPMLPQNPFFGIAEKKFATTEDAVGAVESLIAEGNSTSLISIPNSYGITSIHLALHCLNVSLASHLFSRVAHADIYRLLETKDFQGKTLLHKTLELICIHYESQDITDLVNLARFILDTAKIYRPEHADDSIIPYVDLDDSLEGKPDEPLTARGYFARISHLTQCAALIPYFTPESDKSADDATEESTAHIHHASPPSPLSTTGGSRDPVSPISRDVVDAQPQIQSPAAPAAAPAVSTARPVDVVSAVQTNVVPATAATASSKQAPTLQGSWKQGAPKVPADRTHRTPKTATPPSASHVIVATREIDALAAKVETLTLAPKGKEPERKTKKTIEVAPDAEWPEDASLSAGEVAYAATAVPTSTLEQKKSPVVKALADSPSKVSEPHVTAVSPCVSAHEVFGLLSTPKNLSVWLTRNKDLSLKIIGKKKTKQHKKSPLAFAIEQGFYASATILVEHDRELLTWQDDRFKEPSALECMFNTLAPENPHHSNLTALQDLFFEWQIKDLIDEALVSAATTAGFIGGGSSGGASGGASATTVKPKRKTLAQIKKEKAEEALLGATITEKCDKAMSAITAAEEEAARLNRQLARKANTLGSPVFVTDAAGGLKMMLPATPCSSEKALLISHIQNGAPESLEYLALHDAELKNLHHPAITAEKRGSRFDYYGALIFAIEKLAWNSIEYLLPKITNINSCINQKSGTTVLLSVFAGELEFDAEALNTSNILMLFQLFHRFHSDQINWNHQSSNGFTILHSVVGLIQPTEENFTDEFNLEFINFLLTTCKADVSVSYMTKERIPVSVMHHAVLYAHPQVIELLLRHALEKKKTQALKEGIVWLSNHLKLEDYLLSRPFLEVFLASLGIVFLTEIQAYEIVKYLCDKKTIEYNTDELEKAIACVSRVARKRELSNEVANATKLRNFLQTLKN